MRNYLYWWLAKCSGVLTLMVVVGGTGMPLSAAADALLAKARSQLFAGNGEAAYAMLAGQESERAGEIDFDLLLGRAAIEAGEHSEAVFALERAVAVAPDNAQARALLARALFEIQDNEAAKQTFESVLDDAPSDQIRATVQQYLSALDARFAAQSDWQWSGYYTVNSGFDNNVNSATETRSFALPVGLTLTLGPSSRGQESFYVDNEIGVQAVYRFDPKLLIYGGVQAAKRHHSRTLAEGFDNNRLNVYAGLQNKVGPNSLSFTVSRQFYQVEQLPLVNQTMTRQIDSASFQWRRAINSHTALNLFSQVSHVNYRPSSQRTRNVRSALVGVEVNRIFDLEGSPRLTLGAYAGRDWPRKGSVTTVGRAFAGASGRLKYNFVPNLDGFVKASIEHSDYNGREALFGRDRHDTRYEAAVGVEYKPEPLWTVRSEVRTSHNDSSIALNEYYRTDVHLAIRRDFR